MSHQNKNQQQSEDLKQEKNQTRSQSNGKNKKSRKGQRDEQMQFTNRTAEANFEF